MLLKKRVDYGFGGYQFPAVPRGPRSVRKRGRHKKLLEDNQLCPFELLAAVAGELLQEKESSASSNAEEGKDKLEILRDDFKHEQFKASKLQGSCVESTFIPEYAAGAGDSISDCIFKEIPLTPIISKDVNNVNKELTNLGNMYNVSNVKKDDIAVKRCSLKDTTGECVNNSVQFPFHRNSIPSVSFTKHMNNVNLGLVRDDDENLFGCSSTKFKAFRSLPQSQSRFGYRRIRKIITSKYWKVAPNYERMKPFYRNRKSWYTRELPCKRRKFVIARDQEASNKIIKNSPKKVDNNTSSAKSFQKSRDANVKFRIKSFKVPELYIEVPETATVGALKRSVMEAWSGIVEGGLRVGVVHKGKRVRDDKRTLQQAGISESSNLEALGFALEPRCLNQISPRSISDTSFGPIPVSKMDGKDLVVVRTSNVHRRIRRPFTVGEVEALVEAVETLGTGRWRDVKVRAFDIADHRTYVDLKDKWKTLVHTATISPQQRRGEPVPQELLDRVLSAHSYWSQPSSLNCLNN